MSHVPGRLGELRAKDVMTKQVITVTEDDTLKTAAETLKSHHITGAPVVDSEGKLVGIISITDLVEASAVVNGSSPRRSIPLAHGTDPTAWDLFERAAALSDEEGARRVGEWMSSEVTSVTTNAPLVEVARAMCDGHWHRVPVINDAGALKGIISSMDVLAAIVNIADEAER